MCGITGFYNPSGSSAEIATEIISGMTDVITHRGPDGCGIWLGANNKLALGHRRLAVVDISPMGGQPMSSTSGRYTVVFNGEVYNYKTLKSTLKSTGWRGESDTEVLLEAIERWGLSDTLSRCEGMFAFALWDQKLRTLSLVRDRFGEKPLYYGWAGQAFIFASELKAIKAHPDFDPKIDHKSVVSYFTHGYIPAPLSIYQNIFKLMPASVLTLPLDQHSSWQPTSQSYWAVDGNESNNAERDYLSELEEILTRTVIQQSLADVPVGSFLSGGIDSSLITAILQKHSDRQVQTFSLGFREEQYNEAMHARSVAKHLGTAHHEIIVGPNDLQSIVPRLARMYDEPFGDPSAIPTFIVSKLARSNVTVALTGDGGDELFGGYNRYFRSDHIWSSVRRVPENIRKIASSSLSPIGRRFYSTKMGRRLERLSNYLACNSVNDTYRVQTFASETELGCLLKDMVNPNRTVPPGNEDGLQGMMQHTN